MALIAARDVRRVYRTVNVDVRALDGVSLNIESGQLTTIVGPSGSGKSTLLNILGGMDQPTSGSVVCDGVEIENLSEAGLTKYRRERVGFVFQFYNLIPSLTVRENVAPALEMLYAIAGGEENFRARPFVSNSNCFVVPPMKFAEDACGVLEACVDEVIEPSAVTCCGFGGDRGFAVPELNQHALRHIHNELPANCACGVSTNRTCEIGLTAETGLTYRSVAYLLEACSRKEDAMAC